MKTFRIWSLRIGILKNNILKKTAFILLLFVGQLGWAQQFVVTEKPKQEGQKPEEQKEVSLVTDEKEYSALLSYSPKTFVTDTQSKPVNKKLRGDLNTIGSLELRYSYHVQLNLNESEINWLENEIKKLATAFFEEGTPILMVKAGDYVTCDGKGLETKIQGKQVVTVLHFCYVCAGAAEIEDRFLEIFNKKTESLMASKKVPAVKKNNWRGKKTTKKKAKSKK